MLGVEALERREEVRAEPVGRGARHGERARAAVEADDPRLVDEGGDGARRQAAIAGKGVGVEMVRRARQEGVECGGGIGEGMRGELGKAIGGATATGRSAQVEEASAADGALGAGVAEDEAVAGERGDRAIEHELDEALGAGRDGLAKEHDAGLDLGRGVVEVRRKPLGNRPRTRSPAREGVRRCGRSGRAAPEREACRRGGARPG